MGTQRESQRQLTIVLEYHSTTHILTPERLGCSDPSLLENRLTPTDPPRHLGPTRHATPKEPFITSDPTRPQTAHYLRYR
uniref:Uncharacterized protein n=1 Tax=Echinococcus granulosus TaxID=6210 RepID=A0A068WYU0_ECHGR|nr:hypothetical protein EgrG_002055800 [Echinococcus granulosus]